MIIRQLWDLHYPGLSNNVVHFTGRIADEDNEDVPLEIATLEPEERLAAILNSGVLRAHHPYGSLGDPSVCFTEATRPGLARLVQGERYEAWGVGFTKRFIFESGGAPALYVRGDNWEAIRNSNLPSSLKALVTRFWPGADPLPGQPPLAGHLSRPSQWCHEREWRVPRPENDRAFHFGLGAVQLLVVPSAAAFEWLLEAVPNLNQHLAHIELLPIVEPVVEPVGSQAGAPPDYDPYDPYDPNNPYANVMEDILGLD